MIIKRRSFVRNGKNAHPEARYAYVRVIGDERTRPEENRPSNVPCQRGRYRPEAASLSRKFISPRPLVGYFMSDDLFTARQQPVAFGLKNPEILFPDSHTRTSKCETCVTICGHSCAVPWGSLKGPIGYLREQRAPLCHKEASFYARDSRFAKNPPRGTLEERRVFPKMKHKGSQQFPSYSRDVQLHSSLVESKIPTEYGKSARPLGPISPPGSTNFPSD